MIAREETTSKVPEGLDIAIPVSLIRNLTIVVSLFSKSYASFPRLNLKL
jgi:hypothetical protein